MIIPLLFACETAPEPQGPASGDTGAGWNGIVYAIADDDTTRVEESVVKELSAQVALSDDGSTLDGELTYQVIRGAEVDCDITVGLFGTALSGGCEHCDFAFQVDPEVLEVRGAPCEPQNSYTLLTDGVHVNLAVAFAENYPVFVPTLDEMETYHDAILIGFSLDYRGTEEGGGYYPGPYWSWLVWDGPYYDKGWADLEDQTLSWGWELHGIGWFDPHYDYCYTAETSEATAAYGGELVTGQVDCSGNLADGWGFVAEAGQEVFITADNVDPDADFIPQLLVNGPDGCAILEAQENFSCTASPGSENMDNGGCASARFFATLPGLYEVWLSSAGDGCNIRNPVSYELYIDVQ